MTWRTSGSRSPRRPTRRSGSSARSAGWSSTPKVKDADLRRAIYRRIPAGRTPGRRRRSPTGSSGPSTTITSTSSRAATPTSASSPPSSSTPSRSGPRAIRPCSGPWTCSVSSTPNAGASCPTRRRSISFPRGGGRTSTTTPSRRNAATTSSCASSGSCEEPCGRVTSGWRGAAATPTPRRI